MIGIIARGACSALGEGAAAASVGALGTAATSLVTRDAELAAAGLMKPFCARARVDVPEGADRATVLLERALDQCSRELDAVLPGWRDRRVGAAVGTSSGGMRAFESFVSDPLATSASALSATYIGPMIDAVRPCSFEPSSLVLAACASSTIAIGLGRAWLLEDRCDVVLAGGFDAVSVFVAAGFECLRATCGARGPRPFRRERDGLALGEGAAIVALARAPRVTRVYAWVHGFGVTCDATHLTAPEASGRGLAEAARRAVEDAGNPSIDLVGAHGTATQQNDAAEAAAIHHVLGARAESVPVFSFKGTIGHTLGAAGALEVLATVDAITRGVAPASAGAREGDAEEDETPPACGLRILDRAEPASARVALKLSAAFGGVNAALVIGAEPRSTPSTPAAPPHAHAHVSPGVAATLADTDVTTLARRTGYAADRIARADDLVRLALSAVAGLAEANGGRAALAGAGIVVGHGLATVETNARFQGRIRDAGTRAAEPRRFPYTTPNAAAGECAVAFGLTGPAFAVGGGPHGGIEAIGIAADLVRTRVVDRVVVVAVDAAGETTERMAPGTTSGAVAVLVQAQPLAGGARLEGCTVRLEASRSANGGPGCAAMGAHDALLPLARGRPRVLEVELPWGGIAKAAFFWL